jgi:Rps23 Pro-64 3,4-dihydroxylase Tpa1-like proline 4-hydroxylase
MEFNYIADGIDAIVIDNFYTEPQLKEICVQLSSMTNSSTMNADKDKLEAAIDLDGNFITTKYGVWFNDTSLPLIKYSVENFSKRTLQEKLIEFNSMYRMLFYMNRRSHLLSYYENAGYYSKHVDASVFTILNYFHQEPKNFTGGDIVLHSHDMAKKATIQTKNNRVVIIPSCTLHEVTSIEMTSKQLDGSGRYCCSIFTAIEYLKNKESLS